MSIHTDRLKLINNMVTFNEVRVSPESVAFMGMTSEGMAEEEFTLEEIFSLIQEAYKARRNAELSARWHKTDGR